MSESQNNAVAAPTKNGEFYPASVAVAETVKKGNKNVQQFKEWIDYSYPTLDQLGEGFPTPDSWEQVEVKGGEEKRINTLPVYSDTKLAYVQDCLYRAVQANAKNRAKSDSAEIPNNWTDLLTAADGAKFGTIFKLFKDTLTEWLQEHSGYSSVQCAQILGVMSIQKLQGMRYDDRQQIKLVLGQFTGALEDTTEIQSALNALATVLDKPDADFGFIHG